MIDKPGRPDAAPAADPELEKRLAEKDRDFKRVCQRYARIRSRSGR